LDASEWAAIILVESARRAAGRADFPHRKLGVFLPPKASLVA
jgi:hypothetical protein